MGFLTSDCEVIVKEGENPYCKIAEKLKLLEDSLPIKYYLIQHANWIEDNDAFEKIEDDNGDYTEYNNKIIGKIWAPYSPILKNYNNLYGNYKEYWPILCINKGKILEKTNISTIKFISYKGDYEATEDTKSITNNDKISKYIENYQSKAINIEFYTRGY